jgi:hypothetical protein
VFHAGFISSVTALRRLGRSFVVRVAREATSKKKDDKEICLEIESVSP